MRLMMLSVKGAGLIPYRRLVSVLDEDEFVGAMRIVALRQIITLNPKEELQADVLRELKVTLKDTGLTEYPETQLEVDEIFRRMP